MPTWDGYCCHQLCTGALSLKIVQLGVHSKHYHTSLYIAPSPHTEHVGQCQTVVVSCPPPLNHDHHHALGEHEIMRLHHSIILIGDGHSVSWISLKVDDECPKPCFDKVEITVYNTFNTSGASSNGFPTEQR